MFGGGTGCESGEGSCDLRQVQWTLQHACHYYEAAPPAGAAALSAANFTPRAALFTNKATLTLVALWILLRSTVHCC